MGVPGDWAGSGTPIATVDATADCISYLTVADVRAEFGDDVADDTDSAIQRRIDQMVGLLEDKLGHTFGRALIARSTATDNVIVTTTELTIGGDSYAFATYATLAELVAAVNAAGDSYSLELLPRMRDDTPSTYLKPLSGAVCGPAYENRVVLCATKLYARLSGKRQSHLFLPLSLSSVYALVEDGVALTNSYYWAIPGDAWLIRKACSCVSSCSHVRGLWSNAYPGNIALGYTPQIWGRVPSALTGILLEAFSAKSGLAPFRKENFGDYAYERATTDVASWGDILGGSEVRRYAVRFHP